MIIITEGYEALTRPERDTVVAGETSQVTNEKLTTIVIEPCPILVDQIDTYFVLKPATCYQEIKLSVEYTSKYVYRFIDLLLTEVARREIASKGKGNSSWVIERSFEALAYALRMDAWIRTRNRKQIRGSLKKCYEAAQKLGYLTGYEMDVKGKTTTLDRLDLNPEKFRRMKEVEGERKRLDQKTTSPPS